MGQWVDRYERGQHAAVWTDMVGLGVGLREDAEGWAEARRVARLTMERARRNVEILLTTLPEAGFEFRPPEGMVLFEPPPPDIVDQMDELELLIGAIPLAVRAWYERVGRVNLVGTHEGWPNEDLDALVVDAPIDFVMSEFEDWHGDLGTEWDQHSPFAIDLAPDALHKADISGGPPYGIEIPNAGADGLLLWEPHQTTFNNYLRIAFRWAGMPGIAVRQLDPRGRAVDPDVLATLRQCASALVPL